jgi:uncharacterized LabA/DUF88 family protein
MAANENISMALFCDFENVALGVRDAKFDKFDIKPILERLLLKGSIVVKKAYCDWDRYKTFKAAMHEANFELIEIPHVRQSGKNSADIRLVVDALDLCYTKSHVNTFVIISGDSDFSPLVSKLRENAKQVIGVGVKQSTSDLLIANCDEFIFYDDLVRETARVEAKREERKAQPATAAASTAGAAAKRSSNEEARASREELEAKRREAIDMAVATFDALISERGDSGKIWASALKNAIKRRKPDFNEGNYGFRTFGSLLEEAQNRGQLQLSRDDKSGTYVYRSILHGSPLTEATDEAAPATPFKAGATASEAAAGNLSVESTPQTDQFAAAHATTAAPEVISETVPGEREARHRGRNGRKAGGKTGGRAQGERAEGHANRPAKTQESAPDTVLAATDQTASSGTTAPEHLPQAHTVSAPVPAVTPTAPLTTQPSTSQADTVPQHDHTGTDPADNQPGTDGNTVPAKKRPARPRTPRAPRTPRSLKAEADNAPD